MALHGTAVRLHGLALPSVTLPMAEHAADQPVALDQSGPPVEAYKSHSWASCCWCWVCWARAGPTRKSRARRDKGSVIEQKAI